jgi:hypothetical protein
MAKKPSAVLKRNRRFLQNLPKAFNKYGNCKTCRKISAAQMKCLREIFHNLMLGNIPITRQIFDQLQPFKKQIKTLSKKKTTLRKKRKVLNQAGDGIFPVLFASILPIVLDFIANK